MLAYIFLKLREFGLPIFVIILVFIIFGIIKEIDDKRAKKELEKKLNIPPDLDEAEKKRLIVEHFDKEHSGTQGALGEIKKAGFWGKIGIAIIILIIVLTWGYGMFTIITE